MNLFRSPAGSTQRLVQYAFCYFALYTAYGFLVKYFQSPAAAGFPGISDLEFLIYSSLGSAVICLGVIFIAKWWRFRWQKKEMLFMFLSGTCTALVIPTTTLMYSLPISVMVAMVLMRGSIIVITRLVDSLLIFQGLSKKKVSLEENLAVAISILAVSLSLFFAQEKDFDFVNSPIAMSILTVYICAYAIRIYLMNYFKFTRKGGIQANNQNFFAIEQLSASVWIFGFVFLAGFFPALFSSWPQSAQTGIQQFTLAIQYPPPLWLWVVLAGVPFGFSAFFSVFLFMFEGRTSTFSGLVNRLSSLLAGTFSTLLFALIFSGNWPKATDWISLGLILCAVGFLAKAEKTGP